jgi:hypothetical protein
MKPPLSRGTAVNARRFNRWLADFSGYRNPVTQGLIELWLNLFAPKDRGLAARLLDAVQFIGHQHMQHRYRELLSSIEGWHITEEKRKGRWFFVPFSGSAGKSGDTMLHEFRMANSMTKREYDPLFIHRSELVSKKLSTEDSVILIDDFSGSGKQATDWWHEIFGELLAGGPRVVLMLVAATSVAIKRITDETDMEPFCGTTLRPSDNVFAEECDHFTDEEKQTLLRYGRRADRAWPRGYRDCGLVLVLAHRCPNNSLPILHVNHDAWQGLFPRHG